MRKHPFFRRHPGEGTPMILAIVLAKESTPSFAATPVRAPP